MKKLSSTIVVLIMAFTMQAHNGTTVKVENANPNPIIDIIVGELNIKSIKADIDANRRGYYMTGSFTILKTPTSRDGDVAHTVDASFRNSLVLSRRGSNYIQANAKAKRNDNNSINEFRIYVHHDSGTQGKIDKRNIKVNWKTGSIEIDTKLANVSVLYQKDGILIIGTMQKHGYTIGVSLAIAKEVKII